MQVFSLLHLPSDFQWREWELVNVVLLLAITANALLILAPYQSAIRAANINLAMAELVGLLMPTFALFAQSYLWACYGFTTSQPHIQHFNAWGAGMCLIYLGIIARGSGMLPVLRTLLGLCVSVVVVFSISVGMAPDPVLDRRRVFSYAAMTFSILQSLAPMNQAVEALQMRSAASFPFLLTISSGWTSLLWAQYASMVHDNIYFLANAVGVGLSILELALAGWAMLLSSDEDSGASTLSAKRQFQLEMDYQQPLMPMWRKLKAGPPKAAKAESASSYGSVRGHNTPPLAAAASLWSTPFSAPAMQVESSNATSLCNSKSAFSAAQQDEQDVENMPNNCDTVQPVIASAESTVVVGGHCLMQELPPTLPVSCVL
mmetsp:Transcript_75904/g.180401  ORF Transcript_75904/g.180401 Transcript_75904/m.180401 type:complete len:374 (-) Transcript_75904:161-1282(-)|eukprot:CAMPEP_0178419100 /NCGR_PEP_ID=MMETSP0689_2-20121128/25434_1 /TAXON_ID=160604 /ORGANISM="Amphidinium massartii, Strain CS-259" /LENGTH=373 /DNA_ID=CAMNT_0020040523 /DNA_START=189 /DNA_END=1310 /DNA_ORIENTATION=+